MTIEIVCPASIFGYWCRYLKNSTVLPRMGETNPYPHRNGTNRRPTRRMPYAPQRLPENCSPSR
jgi:hypothetical protein